MFMGMAMCKQGQVDLPWKSEGDVGSLELEIQAVAQLPEVFASEFSLQPHLVIETKFHFVLQFADQASFLPLPPLCWDYKRMSPCLFFGGGCSWNVTQVLMPTQQELGQLHHLPVSQSLGTFSSLRPFCQSCSD